MHSGVTSPAIAFGVGVGLFLLGVALTWIGRSGALNDAKADAKFQEARALDLQLKLNARTENGEMELVAARSTQAAERIADIQAKLYPPAGRLRDKSGRFVKARRSSARSD